MQQNTSLNHMKQLGQDSDIKITIEMKLKEYLHSVQFSRRATENLFPFLEKQVISKLLSI